MTTETTCFVIPHKGREHLLAATLRSISKLVLSPKQKIEVIVVTQNTALSRETLSAASDLPLQVIPAEETLTIAALRNLGAQNSDSEYLAFLDADIKVSTNWLTSLLPFLKEDTGVAIASAMQEGGETVTELEKIRINLSNLTVDRSLQFLPGRNLLMRRTTFCSVHGFPEHLVTCEDYFFTDKVSELGALWYSSRASYVHLGEDKTYAELFRKEIWRGQSNLQSLRNRDIKLREWPSFIVPPFITLVGLLSVALMLANHLYFGLAFAFLAALPFTAYAVRLYRMSSDDVSICAILGFYCCYFPARAWGTAIGVFKDLGDNLHDR
ncbi:glycosyltransferase family A protein [Congregibacter brevis]|uniref:Glycosyltransferase family A protein n=1 Tax=Congregibacter brevis TaxID=3081201 RepID=A0ABZ0IH11_9GAMM|nr:glycosyltransferase family A protein [Congregibacter sp. IMCC45268]